MDKGKLRGGSVFRSACVVANANVASCLSLSSRFFLFDKCTRGFENKNPHTDVLSMLLLTLPPTFCYFFFTKAPSKPEDGAEVFSTATCHMGHAHVTAIGRSSFIFRLFKSVQALPFSFLHVIFLMFCMSIWCFIYLHRPPPPPPSHTHTHTPASSALPPFPPKWGGDCNILQRRGRGEGGMGHGDCLKLASEAHKHKHKAEADC